MDGTIPTMLCSPPACLRERHQQGVALLTLALITVTLSSACGPGAPESRCGIAGEAGLLNENINNPYPSAHQLREDPQSVTGCRVSLAPGSVPAGDNGSVDLERFNRRDGFSPAGGLWLQPGEALSAASLPPLAAPEQSLRSDAA